MSYTTPITDRVLSDVTTPTSKGYFNVADWTRIYNNSRLASALACAMLPTSNPFVTLAAPTITTIPNVSDFNTFLANIEQVRVLMASLLPGLPEIKDDWEAGNAAISPNYKHANQWESVIDAIWDYWNGDSLEVCPNLSGNVTVNSGQIKIYVDCVNTNGFSITVNSGGVMHVI